MNEKNASYATLEKQQAVVLFFQLKTWAGMLNS